MEIPLLLAVSRKQNETVALAGTGEGISDESVQRAGGKIEVLGVKRDNLALTEYKAAMREVEQQAVILDK